MPVTILLCAEHFTVMASLRDCVFVSSRWGSSHKRTEAKSYASIPLRPVQYKSWNEDNMSKAITAVLDGVSIQRASEIYVPKSTLGDKISGRVLPGSRSGPQPYLSEQKEKELVTFLCRSAAIGYSRTRSKVIAIVERILLSRGINKHVSSGWWESLVKRHPQVVLRTPAALSNIRAMASDRDSLDKYFDILEDTMEENWLADKPHLIFNMDETGLALEPKPLKTVTVRDVRTLLLLPVGQSNKSQLLGV